MRLLARSRARRARPSGSRRPATSWPWSVGSVRDALLGRPGADLDFTTDARPEQITDAAARLGRRRLGRRHRPSARSAPARATHVVEITTYRAEVYDRDSRKPEVDLRRHPRATTWAAATSRSTRWRSRCPGMTFVDPYGGLADLAAGVLRTPGTPGGVVRRRPAADAAGGPVRRPARLRGRTRRCVAAMTAMADRISIVSRRAGPRRAGQAAAARRDPRRGPARCWSTPGWPTTCCPSCRRCALEIDEHHRHKDVYEHTLTVLEQAIALEEPDGPAGPTSCCGWPRCCTTSASRRPGGSSPAAASPSTTTRWSAPS